MNTRRFNWPIWSGFLLSLFAFVSYFFIFVWFPVTRDFPWANILLFICAVALLLIGLRRAFANERPLRSKITASIVTTLSVLVFATFLFSYFIAGRWLPESPGAPHVGQKAPDFKLIDTSNTQVSLAELLSAPINGKTPKGVLLIFYRGYW
jgi:hypothetical protein